MWPVYYDNSIMIYYYQENSSSFICDVFNLALSHDFRFQMVAIKCIFVPCFERLDAWVWVGYHFAYNEQGTMPNTLLWKKSHKIRCKRRHVKSTLFKTFLIPTHSHVMACQLSYWLQHRIIYLERNTNKGLLEEKGRHRHSHGVQGEWQLLLVRDLWDGPIVALLLRHHALSRHGCQILLKRWGEWLL